MKVTLLITIALVVFVIFLFLLNIRATLIPSVVIPLALLGACAVMLPLGFSLDNLSLMALTIAVGFVVDDAIVMVEVIWQHLERGETPFEAALAGSREVSFTVLSISISLIAVFTPLMFMGGVVGLLMREFAITLSAAVLVSLALTLTLTPDALRPVPETARAAHPLAHPIPRQGLQESRGRLCALAGQGARASPADAHRVRRDAGGGDRHVCDGLHGILPPAGHRLSERRDADLAGRLVLQDQTEGPGRRQGDR